MMELRQLRSPRTPQVPGCQQTVSAAWSDCPCADLRSRVSEQGFARHASNPWPSVKPSFSLAKKQHAPAGTDKCPASSSSHPASHRHLGPLPQARHPEAPELGGESSCAAALASIASGDATEPAAIHGPRQDARGARAPRWLAGDGGKRALRRVMGLPEARGDSTASQVAAIEPGVCWGIGASSSD